MFIMSNISQHNNSDRLDKPLIILDTLVCSYKYIVHMKLKVYSLKDTDIVNIV